MTRGMIVAPQPEAVEAGAVVLKEGGNAIDAGIACAFVQGVVDPQMTGIAGFGSLQAYLPGLGVHKCIDFHGKAPLATRQNMWEDLIEGEARDGFGFILKGRVNDLGYQSITVPGSLKAYAEAHTKWGRVPWGEIMAPAIEYAREGVTVRPQVYEWWVNDDRFGRVTPVELLSFTESGRKIYFNGDGNVKKIGDRLDNPDMASVLEHLSRVGPDDFYTGEIASKIVEDMEANGGLISAEDLASYQTTHCEPLRGTYRGFDVATNQPPGGGVLLLQMLNVLENFDLAGMGHNSAEYVKTVTEAMKRATADKDAHVGDPGFVDVPVDRLTSKQLAGEYAESIRRGERGVVERMKEAVESKSTTHVCVVDEEGNAFTMTHSLGMPSGVITEGLGFMYNGCMAVFDPRPGRAGSLAPGKSRFSSMCPTIVFRNGTPYVVIGAPGGTQITMGVLQALLNVLDFDMSISDAVSVARFSATSNPIDVSNRIPRFVTRELEELGYDVIRWAASYAFARVHGIRVDDGVWSGGADPAGDGMALGV